MHCGKPLKQDTEEYCSDCRGRKSFVRQGKSVWLHSGPVPGAVYRFKYHNRRRYGQIFAKEMAERYEDQIRKWKIEEIIPVPLHRKKKKKRGYNQAEIIAAELAACVNLPVRNDVLFRVKDTKPQKQFDNRERKRNLQGAFAVSRNWIPCRNVLLIDDIYTTGSTIERSAKMLKKAGAENVYFLTVSIGQGL